MCCDVSYMLVINTFSSCVYCDQNNAQPIPKFLKLLWLVKNPLLLVFRKLSLLRVRSVSVRRSFSDLFVYKIVFQGDEDSCWVTKGDDEGPRRTRPLGCNGDSTDGIAACRVKVWSFSAETRSRGRGAR